MSWILFIQIVVIIMVIGFFMLAAIDMTFERPAKKAQDGMDRTVYYGGSRPYGELKGGDQWYDTESGRLKVWDQFANDWVDV